MVTVLTDINTVTLYGIWKGSLKTYSIYYNPSGGTNGPQNISNATTTSNYVNISNIRPIWTGATFQAWCTSYPSDPINTTCSGTTYYPGQSWTLTNDNNSLYLYAIYSYVSSFSSCSRSGYSGKRMGSYCWMTSDYTGRYIYDKESHSCPSGWSIPTQAQFENLVNAAGSYLYLEGWRNEYWSSTRSGNAMQALWVYPTGAMVALLNSGGSGGALRCVTN